MIGCDLHNANPSKSSMTAFQDDSISKGRRLMRMADLNLWEVASHLMNLAIAYVLAFPIGWDREREERSAGIRTFPLVAIASCGFVLIAIRVLGEGSIGQARILEGLITGVGFIGGGAIIKHAGQASGTATAASLWTTGALGAAVGYGLYDIALILSVITFISLRTNPLKRAAQQNADSSMDKES